METINSNQIVVNPKVVSCIVNGSIDCIHGPAPINRRLERSFRHLAIDCHYNNKKKMIMDKWFVTKTEIAALLSVYSHIENTIKGATRGFHYKMRAVHFHIPKNCVISEQNSLIQSRNFLGEKHIRYVCKTASASPNPESKKDELILEGNEIADISVSAALIQQSTTVKVKDNLRSWTYLRARKDEIVYAQE